jgi:hypothetical protein
MTSKLEVFRADLEALEAADAYDAPQYDYLVEMVERLEAEEKAKPPAAQAPPTEPADPVVALVRDMERAAANPEKFTDVERDRLVERYNSMVVEGGRTSQRVDVAALAREMAAAAADPNVGAERAAELAERYNQAIRQGPEQRTTSALRGELSSTDLEIRMLAAAALADRGEIGEAEIAEVVDAYNSEVHAAAAVGDPSEYPEHLRPIVEAQQAALRAQQEPSDPVERATKTWNDFVLAQRPPTLAEQFEALGLEAEPEQVPSPVSSTSQEA